VDRRDRADLDDPHNRLTLHIIELRGLTWRVAVEQGLQTPRALNRITQSRMI
jgi:hypothetical protein